jgi:hypothetical protein
MVICHSFLYVYQRVPATKTEQIHAENPLKSTDHRSCDLRTAQFPGGPASVREELRERLEIFEAQLGWEIPRKSMEIYGKWNMIINFAANGVIRIVPSSFPWLMHPPSPW